ncbi:hypothetical protein JX265_004335 [Neoarthrinium moseri]|uniref:Uncharacterized protein n=1 Tax=Neoarthrinium moseri TaxID=1658444 RepID=A0A9Q0ASU0_9PEZI|nr:uncharacterized protein JN550_001871 [Neoarthrinium moseri]KAI1850625.1 hypothetical protein JX266_003907 [Neoarthrinium moseri]KAI1875277.1 hypothetical protein JX265_004335 [Neoarthrinium moseri]KAI1875585.1 hypothetical protein JN550_001871 [Neoarthrinium moseri]
MADENFEDDLFADLYDDNDASAAPAPPSAPVKEQQPAAVDPSPVAAPADGPSDGHAASAGDENGYGGDYHENEEAYDDDDDVDFNLGNGSAHAAAPVHQQEEAETPSFHAARGGPSAKEDGFADLFGLWPERLSQGNTRHCGAARIVLLGRDGGPMSMSSG